jgi:hypothetical protein
MCGGYPPASSSWPATADHLLTPARSKDPVIGPCGEFVGRAGERRQRWGEKVCKVHFVSYREQEVYNVKVLDVNIPARISEHYNP